MESINKRKNDQRDVDDYYSSMDDFVLKVRLSFANAIRYTDSSHQVHRLAQEMRQVFEMKLKLFLQQEMNKASNDFGKQTAVETSSSVSVKRLKKENNNLKESHKEKISSGLITRKRSMKESTSVLLQKPMKKSVPSTASVVVRVLTPQAQESRKKKTRQQIGVEYGNQSTSMLTEVALKGSNEFNIHNKDVDDEEVLKAKNSAIAVDDNSERSSGVVSDDLVKLSPNTALRIEAMKRRFAGTILRAEEKMADVKGRFLVR
ncbi:hypothetical protein TIFTF001_055696 [Ficus carica]|uniref:Bromo domain-containing protein n=1 Tax=Ficus carica TaxID=3494 RepID=A0AA88EEM0_FICCA|nr:hypothetical protein TIFTF001_055696 [Ficus carica]